MTTAHGSATKTIAASPGTVFTAVTDLDGLPEWNAIMRSVIERPATLEPAAQWVVEFTAMGQTWRSRSTLDELDPERRRFVYRSGTDDGNPSVAEWAWTVDDDPVGSKVTVTWVLRPATFLRRVLLVRIRSRQLTREVEASLTALAAHVVDRSHPGVAS